MSHEADSYFLGGTWPTLTRTQMTFRVCIPTEQEASLPRLWATDMLPVEMDVSSVHCPHAPVCQWYTVQGCSLQFLTSCRALMLGHWIPPETMQHEIITHEERKEENGGGGFLGVVCFTVRTQSVSYPIITRR